MARVDTVSFGSELKDGYKPVDVWVTNGILWLEDIQQFYRERSAIEKEYSARLTALAKKYYDKKAKKSSSLSVGDTPSLTPGSLESASLTTWTTQLTTLEARAAEHDKFSQDLVNQVAAPLDYMQRRCEDLRKSHSDYQTKLLKERDSSYSELKKAKGRYDTVCQDVEYRRKKQESAMDHGRTKAANAYNQQLMEMHNVKNTYLITINITNKLKERYYHEYVPELLDSLQDLSETRVTKLNAIWALAASLEAGTLQRSTEHMNHLSSEIPRNNPSLDSLMYVRHNITQWMDPPDMVFEPSPVWLDTDAMVVDDTSKIFLRNILGKSKPLVREFKSDAEQRRKEVEGLKRVRKSIQEGKDRRDEVEVVKALFSIQEDLHNAERKRLTAEVEVSTITAVVGDLSLGSKNHNFKSETFKIPTNCDLCGDRIWGLSAKGFICRDCGYTCHGKCELKVPAECPGEQTKEERKQLKAERQQAASVAAATAPNPMPNGASESTGLTRQDTMNSLSSGYATSTQRTVSGTVPTIGEEKTSSPRNSSVATGVVPNIAARRNRIVAPPPTAYVSSPAPDTTSDGSGHPTGKMLYRYEARDDGEVSADAGTKFMIVEPDDGGWTKIRVSAGVEGLVPTSYIEESPFSASAVSTTSVDRPLSTYSDSTASLASSAAGGKKKGPVVAPKRGGKKLKYVEASYSYEAQSSAEFDMAEGERFILISMGGSDGWAEVEKGGETRSVPANYIQQV